MTEILGQQLTLKCRFSIAPKLCNFFFVKMEDPIFKI
jgi:hypothetical protein